MIYSSDLILISLGARVGGKFVRGGNLCALENWRSQTLSQDLKAVT